MVASRAGRTVTDYGPEQLGTPLYVEPQLGPAPYLPAPTYPSPATPGATGGTINSTLYQDPAYAAFMRRANRDEANIENDRIARQEALRRQAALNMSGYATAERQGLANIANEFEGRGMFRSGGRLKRQGEFGAEMGRQRAQTELSTAEGLSGADRDSARNVGEIRGKRGEEEIATRQRLTQRDMV